MDPQLELARQGADLLQYLPGRDPALIDNVTGQLRPSGSVRPLIPRSSFREDHEQPDMTVVNPGLHEDKEVGPGAEQAEDGKQTLQLPTKLKATNSMARDRVSNLSLIGATI